jgi:fatty acid desaturase
MNPRPPRRPKFNPIAHRSPPDAVEGSHGADAQLSNQRSTLDFLGGNKMSTQTSAVNQNERTTRDDSFVEIPVRLTKEEIVSLSRIDPLRSTFHIVAEWSMIIGAIVLCQRFWHPLLYILVVAFIGARQHALMILMHDGVHRRLYSNRTFNDWVAEIVLAWPNLISARAYRINHFGHHRYLNTPEDPDWARRQGDEAWVFPKKVWDLAQIMLRDISGLNAFRLLMLARRLVSKDTGMTRSFIMVRYGFYVALAIVIGLAGLTKPVLLYWVIPMFTWLIFIFRIRSIAEHSAIEDRDVAYAQTRTVYPTILERIFLAPKNVNYHLEHHFFPSVPFYRLPALHALLMTKPGFSESAHLTQSYLGVLKECLGPENRTAEDAIMPSFAMEGVSSSAD